MEIDLLLVYYGQMHKIARCTCDKEIILDSFFFFSLLPARECGDPCPHSEYDESVCGSDGTTYPSQCHLEEAACHNPCLVVEHHSQCGGLSL